MWYEKISIKKERLKLIEQNSKQQNKRLTASASCFVMPSFKGLKRG